MHHASQPTPVVRRWAPNLYLFLASMILLEESRDGHVGWGTVRTLVHCPGHRRTSDASVPADVCILPPSPHLTTLGRALAELVVFWSSMDRRQVANVLQTSGGLNSDAGNGYRTLVARPGERLWNASYGRWPHDVSVGVLILAYRGGLSRARCDLAPVFRDLAGRACRQLVELIKLTSNTACTRPRPSPPPVRSKLPSMSGGRTFSSSTWTSTDADHCAGQPKKAGEQVSPRHRPDAAG